MYFYSFYKDISEELWVKFYKLTDDNLSALGASDLSLSIF